MKTQLIFAGALAASTLSSQAVEVFNEDFNSQTIFVTQNNETDFGGASPEVGVEQWFAASNAVDMNDELQLTDFGATRSRGAGIWLDSSGWAIGTVTVKFDILDYAVGGAGSESFFQAYAATGVDGSNSVGIDVHGGGGQDPSTAFTGTAGIGTIGARNAIIGNVAQATFTFDFTGQGNIALVFHNMSGADTASSPFMPVYSIDNLTVNTVPEPSTYALLAGLTGLTFAMIRRRA